MTEQVEQKAERSNTTLWIMIAVFVVPMIAAYAYYFFADEYSLGNHGDLIEPVVQIDDLELTDIDGTPLARDELIHHWKMFYVAGASCDRACQKGLYNMRQVNIALGKNADRFQHMIIHTDKMSDDFKEVVSAEYSGALHAYGSIDRLVNSLAPAGASELAANAIYIMDPLGNIMMRFGPDISPKLILKDLNRLLKISRIG